jgi:iron complex outermembrane receptor protein
VKKIAFCGIVGYFIFMPFWLWGESVYLNTVRLGSSFPGSFVQRPSYVEIIDQKEIETLPITSIGQLLDYTLGVDMSRRNPWGMQADINIRGCTFQQVLVLINGVRVNDPQTAHHNMDFPITINDIERVEILYGAGSCLYGADAFGGVINLITKRPQGDEFLKSIQIGFSEYNTGNVSFSLKQGGKFSKRISFQKMKSDGFRYDTDFDNNNFFSSFVWNMFSPGSDLQRGKISLDLGFMDKEFGAYDFYTPGMNFPSKEWTKTYLSIIKGSYRINKTIMIDSNFSFRCHEDKYILDINNPSWYVNEHTSSTCGGGLQSKFFLKGAGNLAVGGEINSEEIDSTSLGEHSRLRKAVFAEYLLPGPIWKMDFNTGLRLDSSDWGQMLSPQLGIGWRVVPFCGVHMSVSRAFRIPSFTELYYQSPVNSGNVNLNPEENVSYQLKVDFSSKNQDKTGIIFFRKEEKNLIDWIKNDENQTQWSAENIGKVDFNGLEIFLKKKINKNISTQLGYTYVDSILKKDDYISKYGLKYSKHQISCKINHFLYRGINHVWCGVYKQKEDRDFFILDTRLLLTIKKWKLFLDVKNIFDEKYEEVIGIGQPGRYWGSGVMLKF